MISPELLRDWADAYSVVLGVKGVRGREVTEDDWLALLKLTERVAREAADMQATCRRVRERAKRAGVAWDFDAEGTFDERVAVESEVRWRHSIGVSKRRLSADFGMCWPELNRVLAGGP